MFLTATFEAEGNLILVHPPASVLLVEMPRKLIPELQESPTCAPSDNHFYRIKERDEFEAYDKVRPPTLPRLPNLVSLASLLDPQSSRHARRHTQGEVQ